MPRSKNSNLQFFKKNIVFVVIGLVLMSPLGTPSVGNAWAADDNSDPYAGAKVDYRAYLQQLKALSAQYKQITGEMKEVIKEEGIPVFDENTGEITMQKNLDFSPAAGSGDVSETDKEMTATVEMPGLKKNSIRASIVEGRTLKVIGERKSDGQAVQRLVQLPAIAKDKGHRAKYEDGVLTVTVPKAAPATQEVPISVR